MSIGKTLLTALTILAMAIPFCFAGEEQEESPPALSGKTILMIIAPEKFKDDEYSVPKKIFSDMGAKIKTSSTTTDEAKGVGGTKVKPDLALKDVEAEKYDAIVFIGGPGVQVLFDNKEARKVAKDAVKEKKILAAICLAPGVLAKAGVLKDKEATIWRSSAGDKFEKMLTEAGAKFVDKSVVTDGKIVTANGPKAAKEFAEAIVNLLK
ncbi:MAG: DJ-1/PfpI family protein [Planctomycetota bacterium]|jgi:protease I